MQRKPNDLTTTERIRQVGLEAQYESLVDRLRHAVQYEREALQATEEALKLVEGRDPRGS
jgi:hypothetical protein